ncbi:MAG: helix-turn-helix domain-containing protein [Acidobacteria bacterium]|nr:helix-turn-helix domain-containing protein [Acidobacteriota bacterium]
MTLTNSEIALAQKGQKILSGKKRATLVVNDQNVELSLAVTKILAKTLSYIAKGKTVAVTPEPTEFSSQQAADFLKVSRPFLVKLLETGEIPFRKVGKHRRVRFEDLISYKQQIDDKRLKVLAKLAEQAQELNLGY